MSLSTRLKAIFCGDILRKASFVLAIAAIPCTFSGFTSAAERTGPSIAIGEAKLYPSVRIAYTQNSNVLLSEFNEIEATDFRVSPAAEINASMKTTEVAFVYKGDYSSSSESVVDFFDHQLSLLAKTELGARHRVEGGLFLLSSHETLGEDLTRGIGQAFTEQPEFIQTGANISYEFGAEGAKGNVKTGLRLVSKDFQNLSFLTSNSNFSSVAPFVELTFRVSPSTRVTGGLSYSGVSFDDSSDDRDDVELYSIISLSEDRKFGGTFGLGLVNSSHSASEVEDSTSVSANIDLFYEMLSYSRLNLFVKRSIDNSDNLQDSDVTATQSIATRSELNWQHDWSSRVSSRAFVGINAVERQCPVRDTTTSTVGMELSVKVKKWWAVGVAVESSSRSAGSCADDFSSALIGLDYDRQKIGVFLDVFI